MTVPRFLLPSPARGLDAADRGTNNPPAAGGGAVGRGLREGIVFPAVSTDSVKAFPLYMMGSESSRSLPASCDVRTFEQTAHSSDALSHSPQHFRTQHRPHLAQQKLPRVSPARASRTVVARAPPACPEEGSGLVVYDYGRQLYE